MADQGTEGILSPFLRRKRFKAAKPYLKGRVLDVGCGAGALAEWVAPDKYLGVEVDEYSLCKARNTFPQHRFENCLPAEVERFDVVIALAVIEHVKDAAEFLRSLSLRLVAGDHARIVCTTPHPSVDWVLDAGAAIELFSKHANEEHEELLDRSRLTSTAQEAGLQIVVYKRFLLGANQLAVFGWKDCAR